MYHDLCFFCQELILQMVPHSILYKNLFNLRLLYYFKIGIIGAKINDFLFHILQYDQILDNVFLLLTTLNTWLELQIRLKPKKK
jgi:hypothetical protein